MYVTHTCAKLLSDFGSVHSVAEEHSDNFLLSLGKFPITALKYRIVKQIIKSVCELFFSTKLKWFGFIIFLLGRNFLFFRINEAEAGGGVTGGGTTGGAVTAKKFGDANNDGVVSIADATAIYQAIGNPDKYGLSEAGKANADVAGNGNGVTSEDALAIQKLYAGLVSKLPV